MQKIRIIKLQRCIPCQPNFVNEKLRYSGSTLIFFHIYIFLNNHFFSPYSSLDFMLLFHFIILAINRRFSIFNHERYFCFCEPLFFPYRPPSFLVSLLNVFNLTDCFCLIGTQQLINQQLYFIGLITWRQMRSL